MKTRYFVGLFEQEDEDRLLVWRQVDKKMETYLFHNRTWIPAFYGTLEELGNRAVVFREVMVEELSLIL